jgi:uncharacterized membrane protein YhaH (DUF805 family)
MTQHAPAEEQRSLNELVLRAVEEALSDPDRPGVFVFKFDVAGGELALWQTVLILVLAVVVYFLPALIAFIRRHRDRIPIAILTLLVGWSGIGWLAMLVWAFIDRRAAD